MTTAPATTPTAPAPTAQRGRAWIALLVVSFIVFWPIGLALLIYLKWSGRMFCSRHARWGATAEELAATWPGDELVARPGGESTRAVTVNAPAGALWPWLLQLGQDRGGFYSYDWLENALGLHIHNAEQVVPAWQRLQVGDLVHFTPDRWLGLRTDRPPKTTVAQLNPERDLVLHMFPASHYNEKARWAPSRRRLRGPPAGPPR